ncbi:non-canonical purine NTP diphosphatase [Prevotella amnii]|uniref:dITP/XTP pyrophosphatase n=3 Tax=Prevotella amnii TaxID=419005 RepID=A0A096D0X8_9BACT|nr:non-canonical purine NTP diphosphatase [Prevotella amnii]KGF51174.1 deoxyribonucleotide triphosphate pyrophosphatase [Prevotella amnii DNF00058]
MKIVFATNNKHKLSEIKKILSEDFEIISLEDIGCHEEIPETGTTLEENARLKSSYIVDHYHIDCFADDTGLEVEALNGEPGVYSARYDDTTDHDSEANIRKLLRKLGNNSNRKARFRTIISLIINGKEYQFEGCIEGHIALEKTGTGGFGYDSIFIPENYNKSFASLGENIKNKISHRAIAVNKLAKFLNDISLL